MPPLGQSGLVHCAVLWPVGEVDRFGRTTRKIAREIACRWDSTRRDELAPDGSTVTVEVMLTADRCLEEGDLLFRGTLVDYRRKAGLASATDPPQIMKVHRDLSTADLRGQETSYDYDLVRYRGTLPTLET